MEPETGMDRKTMLMYVLLFAVTAIAFLIGIVNKATGDVLISLPVMAAIILTMVNDKRLIHIPPALVVMVVVVMYISLLSNLFGSGPGIEAIENLMVGAVIGLAGLIVIYALLKELPRFGNERPALVSMMVFIFGIAIYSLWMMLVHFFGKLFSYDISTTLDDYMYDMVWVSVGSLLIAMIFFAGRSSRFFDITVVRFLKKNFNNAERWQKGDIDDIMDMIEHGESDEVEFKSTLRTNLETGEKDKRMERAVLKTIVAFLNTDGGTLLIGVSDDGSISGIDENSFDSRDKMNLHMTNLLSAQIGNEFLPFIDFKIVDISGVAVMKVTCAPCEKPVFLKEGKSDSYFVRSGPSSVELTGMDLINYVNNRKERK